MFQTTNQTSINHQPNHNKNLFFVRWSVELATTHKILDDSVPDLPACLIDQMGKAPQ